jgi:hypothetical protein
VCEVPTTSPTTPKHSAKMTVRIASCSLLLALLWSTNRTFGKGVEISARQAMGEQA